MTEKESSGKIESVATSLTLGILNTMRPRVTVHLNGQRWVFTMDSPKEYAKVKDRLKSIAGIDESSLPQTLGPDVEIEVKIPKELLETIESKTDQQFVADTSMINDVRNAFPDLDNTARYPCTCYGKGWRTSDLATVIMHLNDIDKWERGRIADWIETLDYKVEIAA